MSQDAEQAYDDYVSDLGHILEKVDPHLATQVMYFERKFLDVDPCVSLSITYKKNINLRKKQHDLNLRHGYMIGLEGHGLRLVGRMNMQVIGELASDTEIETITGSASCASY